MVLPPLIAAKQASQAVSGASKALTGDIYVRRWTSKGKGKKPPVEHEVRVNAVTAAVAAVGVGLAALAGGAALWMTQQKLGKGDLKQLTRRVRVYEATWKKVKIVDIPAVPAWNELVKDAWVETFQIPQNEEGHWETAPTATVICPKDGSSINMATATEQEYGRWEQLHRIHWSGDWEYASGQVWVIDVPAGWQTVTVPHAAEYLYHDAIPEVSHEDDVIDRLGRIVVMTPRGVPVKQYSGLERLPTDREVLGPQFAQYDRTGEPWPVYEGEDRLGKYSEYDARFTHKTKKALALEDRAGFLG